MKTKTCVGLAPDGRGRNETSQNHETNQFDYIQVFSGHSSHFAVDLPIAWKTIFGELDYSLGSQPFRVPITGLQCDSLRRLKGMFFLIMFQAIYEGSMATHGTLEFHQLVPYLPAHPWSDVVGHLNIS